MAVQYRAYKHLEGVDATEIGTDNHFGEFNLREVLKVCNSMFSDICNVCGFYRARVLQAWLTMHVSCFGVPSIPRN